MSGWRRTKKPKNLRTDPQLEVVVEGKKQPLLNSGGGGGGQTMGGGCKNNNNNMTTCNNNSCNPRHCWRRRQHCEKETSIPPSTTVMKTNNKNEPKYSHTKTLKTPTEQREQEIVYCYTSSKINIRQRRNNFFLFKKKKVLHMRNRGAGGARVST